MPPQIHSVTTGQTRGVREKVLVLTRDRMLAKLHPMAGTAGASAFADLAATATSESSTLLI